MSLKLETLGSVTWLRRNQQTFRHIFFNNFERIVRRSWVEVPFLYMNMNSPFFWWNLYPHILYRRYIQLVMGWYDNKHLAMHRRHDNEQFYQICSRQSKVPIALISQTIPFPHNPSPLTPTWCIQMILHRLWGTFTLDPILGFTYLVNLAFPYIPTY